MVQFYAKIEGFGTFDQQKLTYLLSYVFILILLINSFHLVPNLPFKSVVLLLFDPKKKRVPNHKEVSFWPFKPLHGPSNFKFPLRPFVTPFASEASPLCGGPGAILAQSNSSTEQF